MIWEPDIISDLCKQVYKGEIVGLEVPMLNVPSAFDRECGVVLLTLFPDAPFVVTWFKAGDSSLRFSLGSEDHRLDVSIIAREFGGGGCRNEAGFTIHFPLGDYDSASALVNALELENAGLREIASRSGALEAHPGTLGDSLGNVASGEVMPLEAQL